MIKKSWWVILFSFVSLLAYNHFATKRKVDLQTHQMKLTEINQNIQQAQFQKEDLMLQLNSQSDPNWIEIVLMKQLGVAPEGYIKVHFKKE